MARNHGKLEIENRILDTKDIYKLMVEFPFDSTRKCMSVIVKNNRDKYFLLTKGADNVMLSKISFSKSSNKTLKETVE